MSGTSKWSDAAVKDLTFAILMSNNPDGSVVVNANWDKVAETMTSWGYGFTKSAMSQHWSKKVLKEFKERHGAGNDNGDGGSNEGGNTDFTATPNKKKAAAKGTPRKSHTPKTPSTVGNKKRAAADDDTSPEGPVPNPIAKTKPSRSVSKKVKYEETNNVEDGESDDDSGAQEAQTKVDEDGDFGVA